MVHVSECAIAENQWRRKRKYTLLFRRCKNNKTILILGSSPNIRSKLYFLILLILVFQLPKLSYSSDDEQQTAKKRESEKHHPNDRTHFHGANPKHQCVNLENNLVRGGTPLSEKQKKALISNNATRFSKDKTRMQKSNKNRSNKVINMERNQGGWEVVITRIEGTVYRVDGHPSCYRGKPTVPMPGVVKLLYGEVYVPRFYNLSKSGTLRLTIHSPNFASPLCLAGVSQYLALPNAFCNVNLCKFIGNELCEVLGQPGWHTIEELEYRAGFNSTLLLPEPPSLFGISLLDLFSGEFAFRFALDFSSSDSGNGEGNETNRTITEIVVPTNHEFLQIGLVENDDDK